MPALRFDDLLRDPDRERGGERWGTGGRPVLLLNDSGSDRSAWWPVAARLADEHAVAVLDLPAGRAIGERAEVLAEYAARLGTRAPVVAGHGHAALVAALFAARYLAHAVVGVEQRLDEPQHDPDTERALDEILTGPGRLRCRYLAVFAASQPGYEAWLRERLPQAVCATYPAAGGHPHLSDPDRFTEDLRELAS